MNLTITDGRGTLQQGLVYCPAAGGVIVTLTGQFFTADAQAPLLCSDALVLSTTAPTSIATVS